MHKIELIDEAYEKEVVNKYMLRYTIMTTNAELFELHHLDICCPGDKRTTLDTVILRDKLDFMKSDVRNPIEGYAIPSR